ncbi:hypothetical protein [Butyrivibrio hungatei]|uniref:Replication-relaxation n=1 Tax=Butyrivibrio hungatei TaxID=185008 RepID=A0A1D9P5B5_9FIRM|nr:hypothetical protein [Butyrivibrio hungatei]AOZ97806.1 hypothetical protein bhn_II007 [Butyrivibrio hungatei]
MNRINPSRFSYEKGCRIENTTIKSKLSDNEKATGEQIILSLLKKYGYMNMMHIQRALNMNSHRTINARKSINKMMSRGLVEKYTITYPGDEPDNDVYILSKNERDKSKNMRSAFRFNMNDIPNILEHLSATQWHISVLEGSGTKDKMFYKTVPYQKFITQVPSLIQIRTRLGRRMSICAIPIPKGDRKNKIAALITQIIALHGYFSEDIDRYGSFVLCLICESESQIEEVSKLLQQVSETSDFYLIYSLDCITDDELVDPLSLIYDVEREDGATKLSVFKLRG